MGTQDQTQGPFLAKTLPKGLDERIQLAKQLLDKRMPSALGRSLEPLFKQLSQGSTYIKLCMIKAIQTLNIITLPQTIKHAQSSEWWHPRNHDHFREGISKILEEHLRLC